MSRYEDFIPENIAPFGARRIGIYNSKGNRVGFIPLGNLSNPTTARKSYSFGALSDIHLQYDTAQTDFRTALTYLERKEDVEFICISGDLTASGRDSELAQYKSYVETYAPNTPVYAVSGNHECYRGDDVPEIISQYTGHPLYYSFTYGNDVFIMLGIKAEQEGGLFTTDELQFLYETLEANRNKRCFIFHHVRPQDGCGNAMGIYDFDLWGGTEATVFESLVSHYKNAIQFHGHSHLKFYLQHLSDVANIDRIFGSWSVHIPSLAIPRDGDDRGPVSRTDVTADSEGYVVDVYENGIHLRGRDFARGEFLPVASYWLDTTLKEVEECTYADFTGTLTTNIPSAYQRVEWIGVSGTQWIDTGVSPQSDNVIYESEWVETTLEYTSVLFGSTNPSFSANRNRWSASHYHPARGTFYSATGVSDGLCKLTGIIVANEKNTLKTTIKDSTITLALNGQSATAAYSGTIQNGVNIGLFANNQSTKVAENAKYTRMYFWRMTDNGVVVRNMIPCYRKSDGVIGMYDTVSKQFFSNAGSGEFTKGEDV